MLKRLEININLPNLVFFSSECDSNNSNFCKDNSNKSNFENSSKEYLPKKIFDSLDNIDKVKSYRNLLKNKSGIYSLVNEINKKQYIGSAKDLYLRLLEHIVGKNRINLCKLLLKNMV